MPHIVDAPLAGVDREAAVHHVHVPVAGVTPRDVSAASRGRPRKGPHRLELRVNLDEIRKVLGPGETPQVLVADAIVREVERRRRRAARQIRDPRTTTELDHTEEQK